MKWVLGVLLLFLTCGARAEAIPHGYLQDVKSERAESFYEIFLFAEPPPKEKPLRDIIFNAELSKEFKSRYRDTFGTIDTDALNYSHNDFDRFDQNRGYAVEIQKQNSQRRDFAGYMMRRLFEWHVDNYVKSEPAMRPVYELKEKMKKVEVRVNKETKLEMRYSLAGNILEFLVTNPYADTRYEIDMDPGAFGPSSVQDDKLISVRPLTRTVRAENTVYDHDGRDKFELIKSHTPALSTSYGVSAAYKAADSPRDTLLALGLSYSF